MAEGRWVKVRIAESGFYELTDELIAQAGFTDPARVKIYGYGGARQPETLTPAYLQQTDDLSEVPTAVIGGRRLFYGVGPVNWTNAIAEKRERNNYSSHGYYFLTENEAQPEIYDSLRFVETYYPLPNDYHALYEVDDYAWYTGGRNLYDARPFIEGTERSYKLPASSQKGVVTVQMTYNNYSDMLVVINGDTVGHILIDYATTAGASGVNKMDTNHYNKAVLDTWRFPVENLTDTTTVTLRELWGDEMRLDFISLCCEQPRPLPDLATAPLPVPEVVGPVPNQDRHADGPADMVIIVPTNRQVLADAQRLKQLHETYDAMRVNIVAADELYNEFSSGTPDGNAYRRYMKMLYDRAETAADRPAYLLLFGDGAWDNRMLIGDWRSTSPDDFLLCYESDNSTSEVECFTTDDYFCLLDDNEGDIINDLADVAVGRLPARTADEARVMVDKTISYRLNEKAGDWQNTVCFMADDGNVNLHMEDVEAVLDSVGIIYQPYRLNKIYWDAYPAVASSNGSDIPDVRTLVHNQMRNGALIMNYTGHGSNITLSKEQIISIDDFAAEGQGHYPLWFMAACGIMPYDSQEANIGETAMLNKTGGAIGVISTTHTVYAQLNRIINKWLMRYLFFKDTGAPEVYTMGEALRKAKVSYYYEKRSGTRLDPTRPNHRQYSLLGDPALRLNTPTLPMDIDYINGQDVMFGQPRLEAGQVVTVEGHMPGYEDFNGVASLTVCDVEEYVTGRNNEGETKNWKPFSWYQRPTVLFNGTDSVRNGQFRFTFSVPKDITYSDDTGAFYFYAVNDDKTLMAHGSFDNFTMGSGDEPLPTSEGPEIYCYLNNALFQDGDLIGESPYFYAEVYDEDGINVSGSGIGHDMELIIDGKMTTTYNLNDNFHYAFGDYRRGSVGYQIPALPAGQHVLLYRVWDVLNNSSFVQRTFVVDDGSGLSPEASGINDVGIEAPSWTEFYNMKGQSVGRRSRSGLYIYRTQEGTVKKMVVGRQ